MDVAVVGAGGDCGRQIAGRLAGERVLFPTDRLQLVGRRGGQSAHSLRGLAADLQDANAETAPEIDVALSPEDIVADIVVMAAGRATPSAHSTAALHRDSLARENGAIFHEYADALARHGNGREVVLVVTNPVELGVDIFSRALGRHRVIGIGAYSDTLRFRREIAADLGVRRQRVHGFFLGEHGDNGLAAWSTVRVHGFDEEELQSALRKLRGPATTDFPEALAREKASVLSDLAEGRFDDAFARIAQMPADLRVLIKPYATQLSGAKTAFVTAGVTVDLVKTLLDGREIVVAGQVRLDGEFHGLHTVIGAPIVVNDQGWSAVAPLHLWAEEAQMLARGAANIRRKIEEWERDA